jgi:hypothetical protein
MNQIHNCEKIMNACLQRAVVEAEKMAHGEIILQFTFCDRAIRLTRIKVEHCVRPVDIVKG